PARLLLRAFSLSPSLVLGGDASACCQAAKSVIGQPLKQRPTEEHHDGRDGKERTAMKRRPRTRIQPTRTAHSTQPIEALAIARRRVPTAQAKALTAVAGTALVAALLTAAAIAQPAAPA